MSNGGTVYKTFTKLSESPSFKLDVAILDRGKGAENRLF